MQTRWLLLPLFVAATGCGGADRSSGDSRDGKADAPLPSFEFRGLVPQVTMVADARARKIVEQCTPSYTKGETSCQFGKYEVGGVGVGMASIIFKDDKFDWFTIRYPTDNFELMAQMLHGVYGEPCSIDSQPMQNAFGAQFSGDEVKWCFVQGELKLRRHKRDNYRLGELDYFTDHPEDILHEPAYNASTL